MKLKHEVQGHMATIDDVGALYQVVVPLWKLGLASVSDVIYIKDVMKTMVMVDALAQFDGCDSRIPLLKKS